MGLHPFVHNSKLRPQALNVILDVRLQSLKIQTVLMQCVQDLLFRRVPRSRRRVLLRLLMKALERAGKLGKILSRQIGDGVKRSGLEVFEASVVEDLAHRALHCLTTKPGRNEWA